MPSDFPASNDNFTIPSTPDTTPLSSSGTSNRNHTQSHEDMGDAIEKIEANVPLLSHDHSGIGPRPTNKLDQANTHQHADTDQGDNSIHHTLGGSAHQAAAGNHLHDDRYPQLDETNTFDLYQIFSGGISVPNAQWNRAQHTHAGVNQGGIALPWENLQSDDSVGKDLGPGAGYRYHFTVPGVVVTCDWRFEVHLHLTTSVANATQLITFGIHDTTGSNDNDIMHGASGIRLPTASANSWQFNAELNGWMVNVAANTDLNIAILVNLGDGSPHVTVGSITLISKPIHRFP